MARNFNRTFVMCATALFQIVAIVSFAQETSVSGVPAVTIPSLISFTGVLRDRTNHAFSGVVGVTFSLYADQDGGTPLWTENQNVQCDEQGRYSLLMGVTQSGGSLPELFRSGEPRWLGIQVQMPGEEERPRIALVSVPYALRAANADTLGGKPASAYVLAQPESEAHTKGLSKGSDKTSDAPTVSAVSGTGTANRVVKWTDASGALGDSSIQDLGTGTSLTVTPSNYLGIGTTNPISKLHMKDTNGEFFVDASPAAGGDLNFVFNNTTAGRQFSMRNLASGRFALRDDTVGVERLSITTSGSVGIGTPTPISKLHVKDTNGEFFVDASPAAGGDLNFVFNNTSTGGRQFSFRSQNSGRLVFRDDTSGVERFTIDSSGNVGIGTTSPTQKLDVAGSVTASTSGTSDFTAALQGNANGATGQTRGVSGTTSSTSDFATGVFGNATGTSGSTSGVTGLTSSTGHLATGVFGGANGGSGQTIGVWGVTHSTSQFANGVRGSAMGTTGQTHGVLGFTSSSTNGASGVSGSTFATTGQIYGVLGDTASTTGGAAGVQGSALGSTGQVFGVRGFTNTNTDFAAGVEGTANNVAGQTRGVAGYTFSTTNGAVGVMGGANAATGQTKGMVGYTNSTANGATGVEGDAQGATGETIGVRGTTSSTTQFATGVTGRAQASTGWTFGVDGETNSSTDYSAGVIGVSSETGNTIGVLGVSLSSSATAGVFSDLSGTGKIISGTSGATFDAQGNPVPPFPEVFRVESDGDVVTKTGDFQTLAAGKGLILKSPNGTTCARLSIDNVGALVTTVITCP